MLLTIFAAISLIFTSVVIIAVGYLVIRDNEL